MPNLHPRMKRMILNIVLYFNIATTMAVRSQNPLLSDDIGYERCLPIDDFEMSAKNKGKSGDDDHVLRNEDNLYKQQRLRERSCGSGTEASVISSFNNPEAVQGAVSANTENSSEDSSSDIFYDCESNQGVTYLALEGNKEILLYPINNGKPKKAINENETKNSLVAQFLYNSANYIKEKYCTVRDTVKNHSSSILSTMKNTCSPVIKEEEGEIVNSDIVEKSENQCCSVVDNTNNGCKSSRDNDKDTWGSSYTYILDQFRSGAVCSRKYYESAKSKINYMYDGSTKAIGAGFTKTVGLCEKIITTCIDKVPVLSPFFESICLSGQRCQFSLKMHTFLNKYIYLNQDLEKRIIAHNKSVVFDGIDKRILKDKNKVLSSHELNVLSCFWNYSNDDNARRKFYKGKQIIPYNDFTLNGLYLASDSTNHRHRFGVVYYHKEVLYYYDISLKMTFPVKLSILHGTCVYLDKQYFLNLDINEVNLLIKESEKDDKFLPNINHFVLYCAVLASTTYYFTYSHYLPSNYNADGYDTPILEGDILLEEDVKLYIQNQCSTINHELQHMPGLINRGKPIGDEFVKTSENVQDCVSGNIRNRGNHRIHENYINNEFLGTVIGFLSKEELTDIHMYMDLPHDYNDEVPKLDDFDEKNNQLKEKHLKNTLKSNYIGKHCFVKVGVYIAGGLMLVLFMRTVIRIIKRILNVTKRND